MPQSATFYVLVASDTEDEEGRRVPGFDVWTRRFQNGLWPLYPKTANAKVIKQGDRVLFYVGGTGKVKQAFVGEAVIDQIVEWNRKKGEVDAATWMNTTASSVLMMAELKQFKSPVKMANLLDKLECAPTNRAKWGVLFRGGIRKFSEHDGSLVLRVAEHGSAPE